MHSLNEKHVVEWNAENKSPRVPLRLFGRHSNGRDPWPKSPTLQGLP